MTQTTTARHATARRPEILHSLAGFVLAVCGLAPASAAQLTDEAPLPGDTTVGPMFGPKWDLHVSAGNGQYFAVWTDKRMMLEATVSGDPWAVLQSDVYAARLAPDGTPIDTVPIRVDGSPYSQVSPSAATNGTDWLVAYKSRSVSSTGFFTTQDLRAVRVSGTGEVLDDTPLEIDTTDNQAHVPTVGSDGTNWAVFWADPFGIFGRLVGPDGTLGPAGPVTSTSWKFDPVVAFATDRYLLVWEGNGIRGRLLDTSLQPLGPEFTISAGGGDPEVATDGTDFYVTIADLGTWAEIRGTVVRKNGTVVNPNGVVIDGQTYLALSPAPVAWDGGGYLVSWVESRFIFPNGNVDWMRLNRMDADGVPQHALPPAVVRSEEFNVREPVAASLGAGDAFLGWLDSRNGTRGYYNGYATIVDAAGLFAPEHAFIVGPPAQLSPDLVAGPEGVTLEDDVNLAVFISADADETRVVFQRIDGTGAALDLEPVVLAGGNDHYTRPVAAWNGAEWLVAWEDITGGTGNGGVLAMRVLPDGTVLDASPIAVLDGNGPEVGALAVVDGDFLVAASQLTSNDIRTLYGRRVDTDGTLLDAAALFLGVNYAVAPSVKGFDDRWLVAWHRRPSHDRPTSTIEARFVLADGAVQPLLDPTASTSTEVFPDLTIVGDLATLAWADGTDIRVRKLQKDGTLLGSPAGVLVSTAPNVQSKPTISADGAKTVVTWADYRIHDNFEPGIGDLFGARLDDSLTVLEPQGVALLADPKTPEGEAGMTGHLGVSVVLAPAMLPSFGNWRVVVGTWRDWDPLGGQLPGSGGPPRLWAWGLLTVGSTVHLDVTDAPAATTGWLMIGLSEARLPFKGGTLVPFPDLLIPLGTDAQGSASIAGTLATALPPGLDFYVQVWLVDPTGPFGWSATQAFHSTTP